MLEIKDSFKFSIGMVSLLLSALLFLFGEPLVIFSGIHGIDYLLGLGLLVGGTWLVEQATGGSWRKS